MLVVWIILWVLVVLVILLPVLLLTPMRIEVSAATDQHPQLIVRARFFGGLAPSLRIVDSSRKKPKQRKRKKRNTTRGRISGSPALVQNFVNLVTEILRKIHIDHLSLNAEFGLGDPAETGHVFGMMTPLLYGSSAQARNAVRLQPNFEQRCFSGELDAKLRFIPGSLALPVIGFVWSNFGPMR